MYYIGIKQQGFNPDNLLSENSVRWLTYFSPGTKLKIQTANHWNSAGVKEFDDLQKATELMRDVRDFCGKECLVALIDKNNTRIIEE